MDLEVIKNKMNARVEKTIESLKKDFSGLRTGRASTALLDSIMVEAYGAVVPLQQVASVSVPESRMLAVSVWDKGVIKMVEKAIRESDLGLNPMNDGQTLRIPLPPLSEERRVELCKIAAKYTETARVSIRSIRRDEIDAVKKMEKDGLCSEDDVKRAEAEIQKITDAKIAECDAMLKTKEEEIKVV